jgi:hypothetical protein
MRRAAIALAALTAAGSALATPRIESISVRPNPVPFTAGKAGDVVIAVSIERPTPLDLRCEAVVYPGDGGRELHLAWHLGDSRTKTARYEYKKAGSYRLKVTGTGENACSGERELTVKVGGTGTRAQALSRPPGCPGGWTLVEGSVDGPRYTCRPRQPTRALRCAEGTSYFSERGEIGCR